MVRRPSVQIPLRQCRTDDGFTESSCRLRHQMVVTCRYSPVDITEKIDLMWSQCCSHFCLAYWEFGKLFSQCEIMKYLPLWE